MPPGEWFSGEVLDPKSGAGLTFYFVSYRDTPTRPGLRQVAADLELTHFETVGPGRQVSPSQAIVRLLLSNAPEGESLGPNQAIPPEISHLADYILRAPVVPIRTNPLALAKLAAVFSGAGVGAGIGFALGGPTPLLIITVPAGIILGGAATGAGYGLRDGLHWKIRQWMGVPPEWKP